MQRKLVVSSSPFICNDEVSTRGIMVDVIIALIPTVLAAVWLFGKQALALTLVSVGSAVLSEWCYERLMRQKSTIGDFSAVVTGLLLAFNLPANAPWWLAMVGSALAIVLVKQIFGGIGQNFMNPALTARTILLISWTGLMATSVIPQAGQIFSDAVQNVDTIASATPMTVGAEGFALRDLFLGNVPGMLGETCKLTLLLGGIYLLLRRVIDWRIPVFFIGTAFILFWIQTGVIYSAESGSQNAVYQILCGSLFLGAFFMATDYVTCPITKWGRVVMGIGSGLILFVIRTYSSAYPEGCSFAILFMNVLTPLIDKWTIPRAFGKGNLQKAGKGERA